MVSGASRLDHPAGIASNRFRSATFADFRQPPRPTDQKRQPADGSEGQTKHGRRQGIGEGVSEFFTASPTEP